MLMCVQNHKMCQSGKDPFLSFFLSIYGVWGWGVVREVLNTLSSCQRKRKQKRQVGDFDVMVFPTFTVNQFGARNYSSITTN